MQIEGARKAGRVCLPRRSRAKHILNAASSRTFMSLRSEIKMFPYVSPAGSVGASASQRCPLDTRTPSRADYNTRGYNWGTFVVFIALYLLFIS